MSTSQPSKVVPIAWGLFALSGLWSGSAFAGDHGYHYHAKVHQHGTLVAPFATANVGTVVHTTHLPVSTGIASAGVPMFMTQVAQPTLTAHFVTMSSMPAVSPLAALPFGVGFSPSTPLLGSAQASTQGSPMLKSASATANYVPEYNAFLQQENLQNPGSMFVAAGVRPHPYDVAALNQNHSQLVNAVGVDRLGSIGRFLITKLKDPNFRKNALKLFEAIFGAAQPQFAPIINPFLDDLIQGSGQGGNNPNGGLPPIPVPGTNPTPVVGGTYNATGVFPGRIVLTQVDDGDTVPSAPQPPDPSQPSKKLKDDGGTAAPSP